MIGISRITIDDRCDTGYFFAGELRKAVESSGWEIDNRLNRSCRQCGKDCDGLQKEIVLRSIAASFRKYGIVWAIGGSMLLQTHGMVQEADDLDLLIAWPDAEKSHELLLRLELIEQHFRQEGLRRPDLLKRALDQELPDAVRERIRMAIHFEID